MAKKKKKDRRMFKMTNDELQNWIACQKRTSVVEPKKGNKKPYNRQKTKKIQED